MEKQIVVFEIEKEHFGVEISCVEGIVKMQEITRVPNTVNYVEGITTLRGAVLPVIDLAKRFGIQNVNITTESRIMVVFVGVQKMGMIVSSVSEVLTIDTNNIEPPPMIVDSINTEFIEGIVRLDQRLVILLNLEKVFQI